MRRVPAAGVAVLLVWAVAWLLRGWVTDDAFFTFRVVDHALRGLGLRWNVDDRVQVFTHPLWMLVQLAGAGLAGATPERVAWAASLLATLLLVAVGLAAVERSAAWAATAWSLAAIGSRSVLDWTSSGLENPLTMLLGATLVLVATDERPASARVGRAGLVAALLALTRPDTPLLSAPVVALLAARAARDVGWRRALVPLLPGAALLAAWGAFAVVYYGSFVPNTALAKLPPGVPASELLAGGLRYLAACAVFDPVGAVGLALALPAARRATGEERALLVGVALYLARTAAIGGCYMLGRLVGLQVIVALLVVARVVGRLGTPRRSAAVVAALVLAHGLALLPGRDFPDPRSRSHPQVGETFDERWLEVRLGTWVDWSPFSDPGPDLRIVQGRARTVHVIGPTGAYARLLPDDAHVLDTFAIGDPFLARLPPMGTPAVLGHYGRELPAGWVEAVADDDLGRLADPALRACARGTWLVSRGPLWSGERWAEIARRLVRRGC